ncbi:MAG: response regulator [Elusimicrobiota bacterium]
MENSEQITILIADDDDGHTLLIQRRFKEVGVFNPVIRFRDGEEAWDFISGKSAPGLDPERQYLLLLDISMPVMDGIEVLTRMKADPRLKTIPAIMLTTTDDPKEIGRCYELGCNNYLVKPVEFEKFSELIKRLGLFLLIVKVGNPAK